jgi:sterol desaturase/sphingolipid hydroxylase (fatty acid hydroxylase superfamily)
MFSKKSFFSFFIVNGCLGFLSFIQFYMLNLFFDNPWGYFLVFWLKNQTLILFIDFTTQHKPFIHNNPLMKPIVNYPFEFQYHVISSTMIEVITHSLLYSHHFSPIYSVTYHMNSFFHVLYFVYFLFLFEIIFDFFHYTVHRFFHSIPFLYKFIHKKHHTFAHPIAIIAFYQDPLDLILSNSVPLFLTFEILKCFHLSIHSFHFTILSTYKTFIEISGHCGKKTYPTCSFPICIWLPTFLNIELYTEDHDLHHVLHNYNFSKRFSLWDKLFNTYKSPFSDSNVFNLSSNNTVISSDKSGI